MMRWLLALAVAVALAFGVPGAGEARVSFAWMHLDRDHGQAPYQGRGYRWPERVEREGWAPPAVPDARGKAGEVVTGKADPQAPWWWRDRPQGHRPWPGRWFASSPPPFDDAEIPVVPLPTSGLCLATAIAGFGALRGLRRRVSRSTSPVSG